MDVNTLYSRIAAFPRLSLATYPTPLEPLQRLTAALGGPQVWIKRDDAIGPAMGGNKTRKLEFLMAEAAARGARKVATFGGAQSNHARITAAAARRLGMEVHLFFFEPRPRRPAGNLVLDQLLGAKMHFIPFGGGGAGMTLHQTNKLVGLLARVVAGPQTYFIPVGGHTPVGCLGYVLAAAEIHAQAQALGLRNVTVVTAAGTGGTLAGLMAGFALLESPVRVLGIDVGKLWRAFPGSIAQLAGDICCRLPGECRAWRADGVPLIERRYVGAGYAVPSPEGTAAMRRLAQTEGLVLDPVYTGKAMAGLLDLVATRTFSSADTLIFLHTGGAPALFAFPDTSFR